MEELIARATAFITEHGVWAGPIVGLLAFGESLAFVGLLIPATALMIAVGGLIGTGVLDPAPVMACAVLGAVLGDWVSYSVGRNIGPSVYRRWPLNRHRSMVARARLFFRRYGFVSIFLGRFLGPIRATIPLVAGVMEMDQRRFQIANISSAVLWVPAMFAPGYLAARSLGSAEDISEGHLLGISLVVVVLSLGAVAIGSRIMGAQKGRVRGKRIAAAEPE
ncbi:DedA family protein [Terrihabitans sp. B22-R8]|uniref:DedA family protein n=1 Tax=Terrihabitans sp. B22-R8 TaxID=3425128 RepID=UPI00403CE0E0